MPDPAALVGPLNRVQAELEAARNAQRHVPSALAVSRADVHAMIDYVGDVGAALRGADPVKLHDLYAELRLEMVYDHDDRAVDIEIRPGRG